MNGNSNTIDQFRELKNSIRGNQKCLVVGIDIAKNTHYAFFGTPTGKTLRKSLAFKNNKNGFQKILDLAEDMCFQHDLHMVVFGLEPTSCYHKPLAEYLARSGEVVVSVSNVAAKRNRESLNGRWDKNDKSCAANVADLISQGKFLYYDIKNKTLRELTSLMRRRAWLRKQKHRMQMRLRNQLAAQYFPEIDEYFGTDSIALSVMGLCPNPEGIAMIGFDEFKSQLINKKNAQRREVRVQAIWDAANNSIGCDMPIAAYEEAQLLVNNIKQFQSHIDAAEAQMLEVAETLPEYECVKSIPGFGPIVTATTLAAIGDPDRFSHRLQVLRMAGLDLCASRSGKTSPKAVPRISKQGKADLRYMLVQAAMVGAARAPVLRRHFSRLLRGRQHEPGIKRKMRVKLASKLLIVAWTLMKKREKFDPAHFMEPCSNVA